MKQIIISFLILLTLGCHTNNAINSSKYYNNIELTASNYSNQLCPQDMIEVFGNYCSNVEQICINLDKNVHNANGYVKCDEYKSPSKCLSATTELKHFCIDTYEWPNKFAFRPEVMVSWNQMKDNCGSLGKRLCSDVEWTLACEGPEMLPYPYGYKRDSTACNIDREQRTNFSPNVPMTPAVVEYLDQRVASGIMSRCISPYGVRDMTGNVDESVINTLGKPFESAEMGGAWILGHRNRCRPKTIVHDKNFYFYEIGGRCCKDISE